MIETLTTVARDILTGNPNAILTGSLALNLQGVTTRRPPCDIDILTNAPVSFTLRPGQTLERMARRPVAEIQEEYSDLLFERASYMLRFGCNAIKIDVFQANQAEAFNFRTKAGLMQNGLRLDEPRAILASKIGYALEEHSSEATREKHRMDLLHILTTTVFV